MPGVAFDPDMTTVVICEQWTMPLGRQDEQGKWFVDWVLHSPNGASQHVTAGYHALQSLRRAYGEERPFRSAAEYFGGMGCQALIVQNTLAPDRHTLLELHPLAVKHLQDLLGGRPGVEVRHGDAHQLHLEAELAVLDMPDMTALRAQTSHKPLLDRVFAAEPKAVVLTDIAGQRLHLQRERYARLLGHPCDTYPAYLEGVSGYLRGAYGYQVLAGFHHRWSAVLALVPARLYGGPPSLTVTPESPRGILIR